MVISIQGARVGGKLCRTIGFAIVDPQRVTADIDRGYWRGVASQHGYNRIGYKLIGSRVFREL